MPIRGKLENEVQKRDGPKLRGGYVNKNMFQGRRCLFKQTLNIPICCKAIPNMGIYTSGCLIPPLNFCFIQLYTLF